jgi:hypothetical protein
MMSPSRTQDAGSIAAVCVLFFSVGWLLFIAVAIYRIDSTSFWEMKRQQQTERQKNIRLLLSSVQSVVTTYTTQSAAKSNDNYVLQTWFVCIVRFILDTVREIEAQELKNKERT